MQAIYNIYFKKIFLIHQQHLYASKNYTRTINSDIVVSQYTSLFLLFTLLLSAHLVVILRPCFDIANVTLSSSLAISFTFPSSWKNMIHQCNIRWISKWIWNTCTVWVYFWRCKRLNEHHFRNWHKNLKHLYPLIFTKYWLLLREIPWDIRCEVISPHRTPDISEYLPKLSSQYLGYYIPLFKFMISYLM